MTYIALRLLSWIVWVIIRDGTETNRTFQTPSSPIRCLKYHLRLGLQVYLVLLIKGTFWHDCTGSKSYRAVCCDFFGVVSPGSEESIESLFIIEFLRNNNYSFKNKSLLHPTGEPPVIVVASYDNSLKALFFCCSRAVGIGVTVIFVTDTFVN